MESLLFPLSKSGRTSVTGSCSETEYLQELERINSEISGFVPITAVKTDAEEPSALTKTETSAAAAAAISKRPLASTVDNQQWRPISMEEATAAKTAMGAAQYAGNEHAGNAQEDPFLTEEYY
ncbi:unnamed protein product [Dibothriocephalus latus]|uniref:Uncharacterized protein n=1 Tax=Dibothriocephalus latus TaxID=60516 RepID=A0A3P7M6K9_DIBLA|nr:unnamed protein product [Dibothriocephalus latus]